MPEFEHSLTKTEVTWGLISVAGIREYFPSPGEKIIVYDGEGREYITKTHSSAARIDGLTDWHKNHPTAEIGDTVVIAINSDKSIKSSQRKCRFTQKRGLKRNIYSLRYWAQFY